MRCALLMLLTAACTYVNSGARGPISPLDRFGTYPNEVEYEVDGARVRGEACASLTVTDYELKRTRDQGATANGYLFEKAKVTALDSAHDADGLIEIRSTYVIGADGNECVVVTGRPYRVKAMHAVASGERAGQEKSAASQRLDKPGAALQQVFPEE